MIVLSIIENLRCDVQVFILRCIRDEIHKIIILSMDLEIKILWQQKANIVLQLTRAWKYLIYSDHRICRMHVTTTKHVYKKERNEKMNIAFDIEQHFINFNDLSRGS